MSANFPLENYLPAHLAQCFVIYFKAMLLLHGENNLIGSEHKWALMCVHMCAMLTLSIVYLMINIGLGIRIYHRCMMRLVTL